MVSFLSKLVVKEVSSAEWHSLRGHYSSLTFHGQSESMLHWKVMWYQSDSLRWSLGRDINPNRSGISKSISRQHSVLHSGYVARKVLLRIKCSKYAEQLLSYPDDPKGSQCVLHPQYAGLTCYRQKGGLFYASEAVLKVLKATEAAFRRRVVETTSK